MLKYKINRNDIISDQLTINYTKFNVEDIDYIDNSKSLVTCYYDNDIDIKENDYIVAVYDEPSMDEYHSVTSKRKFREYKVEGVNEEERFFTLISDKYFRLKGTYISNESAVTYEDKVIGSDSYDSLSDEDKLNYSIHQFKWRRENLITISEYNAIDNDFEKDSYVDCYTNGNEFISMWERFGGNAYDIDSEGNISQVDPYEGYGEQPEPGHKILSPYVNTFITKDEYDLLSDKEKECYEIYSYIYPGGEGVETDYLYVWFSDLHYFKNSDAYPPEIEIDCDDITYTLSNGEIVNDYGLRFIKDKTTEAVYSFFKNNNFYPTQKYIEPVEGTELEDWEYDYTENLDYFIARIDEATIKRSDIVFPPQPKTDELEVDTEPFSSEATNVSLYLKKHLTSISIPMTNRFSTNMYQDYNIKEKFVDTEVKKSINGYTEMEKDVYHPVVVNIKNENGHQEIDKIQNIKEIRFNLHFREHRDDEWLAKSSSYWNGTFLDDDGHLNLMNPSNFEEYGFFGYTDKSKQSDLLSYLNFTNNDVKFQKNVLKKTFIRLSFYDTPRQTDQHLLHYSTIFIDSGKLFGKYTRNFLKPPKTNSYYTRLKPGSMNTIKNLEGIRVDREIYSNDVMDDDIEEYRLSSQFSVKDKYSSLSSSDGFYVYLWKDYDLGITPSDIYLKVEFNHSGYGRTIPFMMPFMEEGGIKRFEDIVDDWNNGGYGIKQYMKYSYIHFKYRYDKETERHVYYLDPEQYGNITLENDKILNINLWEAKII